MILNKNYDKTEYPNLPSVDEDGKKVLETLKFLGVEDKNIQIFKDATWGEMNAYKCKMIGIF